MRKLGLMTAVAVLAMAVGFIGVAKAEVFFPFDTNLVAYYPFDGEGDDPTLDAAPSDAVSNDGTLGNAPGPDPDDPVYECDAADISPTPGNVCSLDFAAGEFVRVPDDDELEPADVTVSVWVRNDGAPTSFDYILAKTRDGNKASYALYTSGTNGLFFYASNAGTFFLSDDAGAGVWDGNWHHIAGVYDSSGPTVRLFVDGAEVGTANVGPIAIDYVTGPGFGDFTIGTYNDLAIADWIGNIDEVRVYNRVLTDDEIEILATSSFIRKEITSGPGGGVFTKVADGITNGSFEDDACGSPFDTLGGPDGLTGWTIGGVSGIDLICSLWQNAEGSQSLDMAALDNGSISQTLTTVVGRDYEVRFEMSGNSATSVAGDCDLTTANKNKTLNVAVDDVASTNMDYVYDVVAEGNSNGDMKWRSEPFSFTADDTSTLLTFTDTTTPGTTNCGAALDNVMLFEEGIAVAVEAPATSSIHYDFKITVDTTGLTDPVVYDTVPAEWTVTAIDEVLIDIAPGDDNSNFDENLPDWPDSGDQVGVGCGGFQAGLGDGYDVTVSRGGSYKKNKCSSSTHLVWEMVPNEMDMIRVDLQSRGPKKNGKFKPTFCGALYLNNGAVLMDGSTVVGETGPLVVASMFDLDGGGIDPTGQGDEDHDGATDIDEVRVLGTDPCDEDTDNDGVLDGADLCPLEGLPNLGAGETLGGDGCIIFP